ncbi:MAG: DUF2090 domain-containing protein, partial [Betaproteobacteria bacterium]
AAAFLNVSEGRNDTGVLLDDYYGENVLPMLTGKGLWIARPVETPGSIPVEFEAGANAGLALRTWPTEHVVKCLVFYHPDDADGLKSAQIERMRGLAEACHATGHELLLEIIPPDLSNDDAQTMVRALTQLYDADIRPDWWKLPPSNDPAIWHALGALIAARDPFCQGMLVLGMEASADRLETSFAAAASEPRCRGFAVGRTVFAAAAAEWFAGNATDAEVIDQIARGYRELIALWDRAAATNKTLRPKPQLAKGIAS